jgi:hypothetical protein
MKIVDYRELKDQEDYETGVFEVVTQDWLGREKIYTGTILGLFDLSTGRKWRRGASKFTEYIHLEQLRAKVAELKKPVIKAVD